MISALEIFRIGLGPSSSHTVGPMRIGSRFVAHLRKSEVLHKVATIEAHMQGSLAFTGKGHHTPQAIIVGIGWLSSRTTEPNVAASALEAI
ncbi:MAG: L-serine ammonia-lyase, partial [Hyphomonadaceae bacterium]|nr:L-serine ammonia-lyase [Hyphomonadaceae bacterium]